jgi:hypothetical protein
MSHFFSIKTMWRSFFCALMATVSLSVGWIHVESMHSMTLLPTGYEPLPHGQTRTFPSHLRQGLAFLRDCLLYNHWNLRGRSSISAMINHHSLTAIHIGSLWSVCHQIQHSSSSLPPKTSLKLPSDGSCHTRYSNCYLWLFQSVLED